MAIFMLKHVDTHIKIHQPNPTKPKKQHNVTGNRLFSHSSTYLSRSIPPSRAEFQTTLALDIISCRDAATHHIPPLPTLGRSYLLQRLQQRTRDSPPAFYVLKMLTAMDNSQPARQFPINPHSAPIMTLTTKPSAPRALIGRRRR